MADNFPQPKEYDVVMGGHSNALADNAVLGGIERVKQLLAHGNAEQKIDALLDAFDYGEAGLDLIIQALQNSAAEVTEAAYWLLQENTDPKAKLALQAYNPYLFFEYLFTIERYTDEVRRIACVDVRKEWQTLVTCNYNNIIQVWNMQTQQVICTFQPEEAKEFYQIAITSNHDVLGLWNCNDYAEVWDLKTRQIIFTTNRSDECFWIVYFSPDGQTLVSTGDDYILTFWDINEQKIRPSIHLSENIPRRYPIYSNSQILVAEENFEQKYEIWDWQTEQVICTFSLSGHMPVITVSLDQRFLLSGSRNDGIIKVWSIQTGHQLCNLTTHLSSITGLAISSDGQILFIWSQDGIVQAWGTRSNSDNSCNTPIASHAGNFVGEAFG